MCYLADEVSLRFGYIVSTANTQLLKCNNNDKLAEQLKELLDKITKEFRHIEEICLKHTAERQEIIEALECFRETLIGYEEGLEDLRRNEQRRKREEKKRKSIMGDSSI